MEDALEELVGEIWDETDIVRKEIHQIDKSGNYLIAGTLSLDKFFSFSSILPSEDFLSNAVSGFIMEQLNHIPAENESFTYEGLRITVNKMEHRRIKEIIVTKEK